jgi:hypothetical protein
MEHQKHEDGEEGQAFLREPSEDGIQDTMIKERKRRGLVRYARVAVELAMVAVIVFLLAARPYCGRDTIRRTPVPKRKAIRVRPTEFRLTRMRSSQEDLHIQGSSGIHEWRNVVRRDENPEDAS